MNYMLLCSLSVIRDYVIINHFLCPMLSCGDVFNVVSDHDGGLSCPVNIWHEMKKVLLWGVGTMPNNGEKRHGWDYGLACIILLLGSFACVVALVSLCGFFVLIFFETYAQYSCLRREEGIEGWFDVRVAMICKFSTDIPHSSLGADMITSGSSIFVGCLKSKSSSFWFS